MTKMCHKYLIPCKDSGESKSIQLLGVITTLCAAFPNTLGVISLSFITKEGRKKRKKEKEEKEERKRRRKGKKKKRINEGEKEENE